MNIAIIWWGAAGLMTLASILEHSTHDDIHITLYEKNSKLWAKIRISWWGRCNITTGKYKKADLLPAYIRGSEFLSHALSTFWPKKMRKRVEDHHVSTKQEADWRIFPVSDNGDDVVGIFEKICKNDPRVTVVYKSKISDIYVTQNIRQSEGSVAESKNESIDSSLAHHASIDPQESQFDKLSTTEVQASWDPHVVEMHRVASLQDGKFVIINDENEYIYDKVILATWWNAYAHTWSSWDGYAFARNMWHTVSQLWPSLNSFLVTQEWIKASTWLARPQARIYIPQHKLSLNPALRESQQTITGPVLMTHFWLSGPAIFAMAAHIAFDQVSQTSPYMIKLILDHTRGYDFWNTVFIQMNTSSPKKTLAGFLSLYMPKRFVKEFLVGQWYDAEIRIWSISKLMRKELCKKLGEWIDISLIGRRAGDEFVTAWGIHTDQLDPLTMQSLIQPGLYIVGELANVDGVTGGYNLQASWSMWYCAGKSIVDKSHK